MATSKDESTKPVSKAKKASDTIELTISNDISKLVVNGNTYEVSDGKINVKPTDAEKAQAHINMIGG